MFKIIKTKEITPPPSIFLKSKMLCIEKCNFIICADNNVTHSMGGTNVFYFKG